MYSSDPFFNDFKITSDHPKFLMHVFSIISKKNNLSELDKIRQIIQDDFDGLTNRLDRSIFQESSLVRNVLRSRQIAEELITNEGDLDLSKVQIAVDELKQCCYSLGPSRQVDSRGQEHLLHALSTLLNNKDLQNVLKSITKPYSHKTADQILRETLRIPSSQALTDAHAKRAVLSAWFTHLRQNVGSCFATAPAIIVQKEQPLLFFQDMKELLNTGRIKRTFGGNQYIVPLSSNSGVGEFKRNVLLFFRDIQGLENLSYSPGLMQACEAVSLINGKAPLKQRIEKMRGLFQEILKPKLSWNNGYTFLSPEFILKILLMNDFQITEKDLQEYENRPRSLMQTSLFMTPILTSSRGKTEACSAFHEKMKLARAEFNSLTENPLLKMWEYSLASFAETKPAFTRWNMYASLGFNPEQAGGIADCLYHDIKLRLDEANGKVKELQGEYEVVYGQLKFIEGRLRQASTEKEAQWGRIEYESKRGEFRALEELRDREHFKAGRYANLLNDLLEKYDTLFPTYFQEVYDADMHEVTLGPYDDSPAGFRLLYKHGRDNTSLWTLIYTPQEFIDCLASFFVMTETEIANSEEFDGLQNELSQIITHLVAHVKTDEFLISAFERMATAHNSPLIQDPLNNLEKIDKKPWAYTSGGTMNNLISSYFRLEESPKVVERWVENEMELLVFLIDSVKQMPHFISDVFLASDKRSLLIHSPTHAFTFEPGWHLFKKAVEAEGFTYTYVRDYLVRPAEHVIEYMFLDQEMMHFFLEKLAEMIPEDFKLRFQSVTANCYGKKNPPEFRRFIVDAMEQDPIFNLQEGILSQDDLDSALFRLLPLTSRYELKNRAEKILENLPGLNSTHHEQLSFILDAIIDQWGTSPFITAEQLQDICKAALCIVLNRTSTQYDYPKLISQAAQRLSYAQPEPIIFGDTNWVKDLFAFAINPGTAKLELFRIDSIGRSGKPMREWKKWLNGSDRSRTWGVYIKPQEYNL